METTEQVTCCTKCMGYLIFIPLHYFNVRKLAHENYYE